MQEKGIPFGVLCILFFESSLEKMHLTSNAHEIPKNTVWNVAKIVLTNASSGATLSSAFCSSKSYPTVEMPTAGALKHTADEPIPDKEEKKSKAEAYYIIKPTSMKIDS